MLLKTYLFVFILTASLFYTSVTGEEEEDDEEERVVVPECPYEYKDGLPVCPNVTTGGAIPKLMQCANKMKHDFMGFCKSIAPCPFYQLKLDLSIWFFSPWSYPPSLELLDKVREQCIEVCILPCLPMDMMSMAGECDVDLSTLDISMDMFCDKKKQKIVSYLV